MQPDDVKSWKKDIRKEILSKLRGQAPSLRDERSRKIQDKLIFSEDFRKSRTIMTYVAVPTEVDTGYLIKTSLKMGKRVTVPFINADSGLMLASEIKSVSDLEKGLFGIYTAREGLKNQVLLKEIDLIVVPAIAYDRDNNRLGRGKAYYDRLLGHEDLCSAKTVGLAFRFQIIDRLPTDLHDRPVSMVVTD